MKSPPASTLYRFIPATRREEFGDKLKSARLENAKATLAQCFELREPKREPGFFKWFSYVAQVISAKWTNRDRTDDRKLVLVGMKSILERRSSVGGFTDSLDGELKSLRERSVDELAADARVNIGSLAEKLGKQLDRVAVDAKGSPYLVAEDMNQGDRAAQIERDSGLREANSRTSSPQPIAQATREPAAALQATQDVTPDPETQQVPSNLPKRLSGETESSSTRLGRSERRLRTLSSRSVNPARTNATAAPATRASLPTDFVERIGEFASSTVENWEQLPVDVRQFVIRKLAAEALDAPPQSPEHWASRAKEICYVFLKQH